MYVFKNALINVRRAKGRSILSFILILVIAISACVALNIKSSAETAKQSTYDNMSITAQISTNRSGMMQGMQGDSEGMQDLMSLMSEGLSNEEYELYATAESVSSFYYTAQISLNAQDEDFVTYTVESSSSSMMSDRESMGGMTLGMGTSTGDFTVVGYSSHDAMTTFIDGTVSIISGAVFDADDDTNACVISEEISLLNDLSVGDELIMVNPSDETDVITFTISGIFTCESTDAYASDIYISYTSLESICENSAEVAGTITIDDVDLEISAALTCLISGVYVFESPTDYENFATEAASLGLDTDTYTISSSDLIEYEESVVPLENLSAFTMVFFIIVLVIGAIILIVFNLFTIRERKYEIGVLAAIGMTKGKVATQFISEVVIVTFVAVIFGSIIGSIASIPVGEVLLESQISSVEEDSSNISDNFGGNFSGTMQESPMSGGMSMDMGSLFGGTSDVDYVDDISYGISIVVLFQLMALALLLSVFASSVGIVAILRYEPLKILSERS